MRLDVFVGLVLSVEAGRLSLPTFLAHWKQIFCPARVLDKKEIYHHGKQFE